MVRKLLKCDLAAALGLSASMVSRHAKLGMPTHDVGAAHAWRATHLAPHLLKTARATSLRRAPNNAGVSSRMFTLDEIAELIEEAGEEIVAGLVVECELTPAVASLAVSVLGVALDRTLEARGDGASPLWDVHGPRLDDEATRARILARVEQLRAELDGVQMSAS